MKRTLTTMLVCVCGLFAGAPWAWADAESLVDAAKAGDTETALALIEAGADATVPEVDGTTALHWAAHRGDADLTAKLIAAGADVAAVNDYGATPMSEAAITADTSVLRLLLEAGADADSPTPEGQTALMAVARTGNVEAAELLLAHGAKIDAKEQWSGQTALIWAAAQHQPAMVATLVAHGADVDARSVVRDWQRRVTAEPRIKDMNLGGLTPLLYAAREACIECARHLIDGGADIDLPDPEGVTPLLVALVNAHFEMAEYLIDAGANPRQWDWWGRTPLYAAIDLNQPPTGGRSDLPSADATTGLDIARRLLDAGVDVNFRLKLEPPLRSEVFDRGSDSRALRTGATPLLRAAYGGDLAAVDLLLEHGARVDLPNDRGVTPTMAAAGHSHGQNPTRGRYRTAAGAISILERLLAAGGDINAADHKGETALHGAARKGWTEVVAFLAEHGADLHAQDDEGRTALDYARGDAPEVVRTLGQVEPPQTHPETAALLERLR